ncbi:MAG: CBS and ACT domain-containing protein [Pseudomonadota bacterium]
MLIKNWMSKPVISITGAVSLNDAARIFKTNMISMLPVMENGKLVGIITDGDINKAMPSDATTLDKFELPALLDGVKIGKIMSSPVITIESDHTIYEAAGIMLKKQISGMPVIGCDGALEGILTKSDIFRGFVSFTGIVARGQIFAFKLKDRPGVINILTNMIRKTGGRLCSIMTSYDNVEPGFRTIFIHSFDIDPFSFGDLVEKFEQAGELLYVADLSSGYRKIYEYE